ncbi:MAG: pyridoxine 5'-phosphate synthase [Myxococcota bacterium]
MSVRLHIKVDHVATVRNARGTPYPDPVFAAQVCEHAGADGITAHLRRDRRHIRDTDVERLRSVLTSHLTLELAAHPEMMGVAERIRPDAITLVPETADEGASSLDLGERGPVAQAVAMAREHGIKTSLRLPPNLAAVDAAKAIGAEQVELDTRNYAQGGSARELGRLRTAAARAHELSLEVAVGSGLTRHNLIHLAALPHITEMKIGHAVVADAVFMGLSGAVRAYRTAIERGLAQR